MNFKDAEIITIGDEIISGHTIDANAAFIARKLADIGIAVRFRTSVGDSPEDMEEAFHMALGRVKLVITTGGLGPTDDDLTKRAIVKLFHRNLVFHEEVWDEIRTRYEARGITLPAVAQNQALLPQGAHLFQNSIGSAVGIGIMEDNRLFISLPGVPAEMGQIITDEVLPYLLARQQIGAIKVKSLRTTGLSETVLAEMVTNISKLEPNTKIAYLPSEKGVTLRVTARGESEKAADAKVDKIVKEIEKETGKYIYGYDDDTLEAIVGQLLSDNDKTLSVAESCTGGQLGMTLTSVPGSSAYFLGGTLAYSNEVKIEQLGVDKDLLSESGDGAVSEECAKQMASGCRKKFNTDFSLSITGVAGPDGSSDSKPVGTVFIGLADSHETCARKLMLGTDRTINRSRAVYAAIEMLRRNILDIKYS